MATEEAGGIIEITCRLRIANLQLFVGFAAAARLATVYS